MPRTKKHLLPPSIQSCKPREWREWNFDKVPPIEREQCYLYEYCSESSVVPRRGVNGSDSENTFGPKSSLLRRGRCL